MSLAVSFPIVLLLFMFGSACLPCAAPQFVTPSNSSSSPTYDQGPFRGRRGEEICLNLTASPTLAKFVDALPTMPVIFLANRPKITLGAYKISQKLHRDLPPTTLYAFGTSQSTAVYPGPTLIAEVGRTAEVRWENHIPDKEHFLPIDRTLDWANPQHGGVPLVVHNHGQEDPPWSDGHPQAWFTPLGEHGEAYVTQDYIYPNEQVPTTLWYHDHTFGVTRLGIASGLVAAYLVESEKLTPAWVPREYHTLIIQDKAFYADGGIKYPTVGINPDVHPVWCPDYFGDVVLVNGKAWPYFDFYPRIHRFRLINAANSKFFVLTLTDPNLRFIKIASDAGFLKVPVSQRSLRIAPAERWEFLIDFSRVPLGRCVEMLDTGPAPFPNGAPVNQSVMLFCARFHLDSAETKPLGSDSAIPTPIRAEELLRMSPASILERTTGTNVNDMEWYHLYKRPFVISVQLDSGFNLVALFLQDHLHFDDPPTEVLKLYKDEAWVFINPLQTSHPIHLHLVNFVIPAIQPFNISRFVNNTCSFHIQYPDPRSCYTGPVRGPDQDQIGFKDTGVILSGYVTWFWVTASPNYAAQQYSFDPTAFPHYVWHCHLLEHEDNEMMRPLVFTRGEAVMQNASFPGVELSRPSG